MTDLRYDAIILLFTWMVIDSVFVFRHKTGKAENRDRFSLPLLILGGPIALWISIGFAFSPIGALHSPMLQWFGLMLRRCLSRVLPADKTLDPVGVLNGLGP